MLRQALLVAALFAAIIAVGTVAGVITYGACIEVCEIGLD